MADTTVGIVLKAATDGAKKALSAFGGAAKTAFGVAAGAAVAAAGAIAAITMKAAGLADKLFVMSDRTGASVEFLSAMGFAAKQTGSSMGAVEKALSTVVKNAASGSKTFERWGVSLKNADGTLKSSQELFGTAANKIASLKSETARLAAAQDIFGKAGKELLPMLRDGADGLAAWREQAEAAGVIVDSLAVRLGAELDDQLTAVNDQMGALTMQIGAVFMPIAIALVRQVRAIMGSVIGWVKANRELMQSKLTDFLIWLADNALPAVAVGVDMVAKIWLGWKLLFQTLEFAANAFISGLLEGFAAGAQGAASLARAIGADGIAGDLEQMARSARISSGEFAKGADEAFLKMAETNREIQSTESAIGKFGAAASGVLRQTAIDAAAVNAEFAAMGETGSDAAGPATEIPGDDKKKKTKFAKVNEKDGKSAADKARLAALKNEQKAVQALQQQYEQLGGAIGDALGTAFAAAIKDSNKAGEAFKEFAKSAAIAVLDLAEQMIIAAAAGAGAQGAQSASGLPWPANVIMMPIVSAFAFGLARSFLSKLHTGGGPQVPLGQERLMLVQGGETLNSIAESRREDQRPRDSERMMPSRGMHVEKMQFLALPSRAQFERALEDRFHPTVDRMAERGIKFGRSSRRPLET